MNDQTIGRRKTIEVLQLGRAIAAIAVVFYHTLYHTETFIGDIPAYVESILQFGYLGVDFFFVLSGFIIYYTNAGSFRQPGWAARYLDNRLRRIFLPYLPIATALALFHTLMPHSRLGGEEWSWITTLTLIPVDGHYSILGVAWTLTYELAFYFLAFAFFASGKPLVLASVWAGTIIAYWLVGPALPSPPDLSIMSIVLNPINLEFMFGMAAAWMIIHGKAPSSLALLFAGAASFTLFAFSGGERSYSVLFGLGLACFLIHIIGMELRGKLRIGAVGLLLGNASYAIYLLHPSILSLVTRLNVRFGAWGGWEGNICWAVVLSAAAGVIYYLVYERPVLELTCRRQALGGAGMKRNAHWPHLGAVYPGPKPRKSNTASAGENRSRPM